MWRVALEISRRNTSLGRQGLGGYNSHAGCRPAASVASVVSRRFSFQQHRESSSSSKENKPLSLQRTYRYLKLQSFTPEEIQTIFDRIQSFPSSSSSKDVDDDDDDDDTTTTITTTSSNKSNSSIHVSQLQAYLMERIRELEQESEHYDSTQRRQRDDNNNNNNEIDQLRAHFCQIQTQRLLQVFSNQLSTSSLPIPHKRRTHLTRDEFQTVLTTLASRVDVQRTWPITASMLLVGASVGVITPAMPFVVEAIGLTPGQYGTVVSAFALAKMSGNIPAAIGVERHGRKPYMTYSLALIAAGVSGIGLANSFESLYLCRLLTGLGVAALSTAGTMMMTDLSTPLNRASTMAPIMSAFAAGTALGPALGGYLVDNVGLHTTFYMVGVSYLGVASLNRYLLEETQTRPMEFHWQQQQQQPGGSQREHNAKDESLATEIKKAVSQWIPLARDRSIRNVLIMNGIFWVSLAGSQMTLLPLILTSADGLAMTATEVGQVYMCMSTIQIVGNPIFAKYLVDRVGKAPAIAGGCTLISLAMAVLPTCASITGDMTYLAASLALWSVGSSMLSTAPVAYISDQVGEDQRAQAIAMLRTSGDVGFLIGASGTGALADLVGSLDFAMQSSAGLLLTATSWFAVRQVMDAKLALSAGTNTAAAAEAKKA